MNTNGPPQRTRAGAAVAALLATAMLLVGCAEGGPTGQSPAGNDGTDSTSTPTSEAPDAMAYAECMRENGVPGFPDPNPGGEFAINANELGVAVDSEQYQQAEQTCVSLLPVRSDEEQQQDYQAFLAYAQCMRDEGISAYPDPPVPGDGPDTQSNSSAGQGNAIDPSSPQFQAAHEACQQLLPGSGGGSGLSGQP